MSPIVIIVFAPVVVLGLLFYAVLLGAAVAGIWESAEARAERRVSSPHRAPGQAPMRRRASTRAA